MKPQLGLLPAEPERPRLGLPLVGLVTPPSEIHNIELDSDTDMLANGEYSCCAVSGLERDRRVSRAALGLPLNKQSASQVLAVYQQYVGTTAKPGPGIVLQRLLEWVRKNPAGFGGDHLLAFGDPRVSQLPIRQMVNEFHSGLFGTEIDYAQTYAYSAAHGWIWDAIPSPEEGGHCEAAGSFDPSYIYCKTWGRVAKMTPAYVAGKMGEVWATVWDFEWNSLTYERQTQIIGDLAALTSDAWNGPAPVQPAPPTPSRSAVNITAIPPVRLLDTRSGNGLSGKFTAHVPRSVVIAGRGGIPANASIVAGTLTVANAAAKGNAEIGPDPIANPSTSTLNFKAGDELGAGFISALRADGTLALVLGDGTSADLIVDIRAYFTP